MSTKRSRSIALIALLLAAAIPAGAEDLTIVSKLTGPKGTPPTSTQYISAQKIRTSDGRYDTIIDVASGRMISIDHNKKTYSETTLEEMRAQFAEIEKMMQDNPMIGAMFGSATAVEVIEGSGSGTYAGYSCQWYQMTLGQKMRFEICAAPGLETPYSYYDARKMAYATMGPLASRFDMMWEEMKKIQGFPLATRFDAKMMGINLDSSSEATEVRKGPIPAGTFEPPAGYKMKKSPYKK